MLVLLQLARLVLVVRVVAVLALTRPRAIRLLQTRPRTLGEEVVALKVPEAPQVPAALASWSCAT